MDSSTKFSDRISYLEHYNENSTVSVTVYWSKPTSDENWKDTSNRRWLRRQVKRIVENIDEDVQIHQLDLFGDSTEITFYHDHDAAQFILENS